MSDKQVSPQVALDYRKRICRAMDYISHHLDADISLDEVAKAASFSKFHFHRVFKAVVGETVAEFARRLRLERAANRLLVAGGGGITTIAIECGFSSSQNFARAFRAHFGMSPSEYRESKIGNKLRNEGNDLSLQSSYDPEVVFGSSNRTRRSSMNAEVKEMPQRNVAYVRKMGPYGKETSEQAFGELMQWAGPRGLMGSGSMLGVYWDNPEVTPPEKCRTDACLEVPAGTPPEGAVGMQTIHGGPYAVCHFEISEDGFQQAWDDAFAWLVQSGHECEEQPCYELYHNNGCEHPQGLWLVDICIPLKSRG